MTISVAISEGFRLIHRNWQLILIHFLISVMSFLGFLVIVGIPMVVAFIVLGIDLAIIGEMKSVFDNARDPAMLLNKYLGLFAIAAVSLLVYLLYAFSIFIFGIGGSAGVIADSLRTHQSKFSTSLFFTEGKRWFFPLIGFTSLVGFIYIGAVVILAVGGGLTALAWEMLSEAGPTLGLFLKVFISLSLITLFMIANFGTIVVTAGGIAVMIMEDKGPMKALGGAFRYIDRRPGIVWLIFVLIIGYITVQIAVAMIGYPLQLIPLIGMVIALPYQLLSYVLQGYLSLVMLASVIAHYFITIADRSTGAEDTSHEAASV